jgi:hypothetical protein
MEYFVVFYYYFINCFIILKKGLGDFVPGQSPDDQLSYYKLAFAIVYVVIGIAVIAMCFDLAQKELLDKYLWVKKKFFGGCSSSEPEEEEESLEEEPNSLIIKNPIYKNRQIYKDKVQKTEEKRAQKEEKASLYENIQLTDSTPTSPTTSPHNIKTRPLESLTSSSFLNSDQISMGNDDDDDNFNKDKEKDIIFINPNNIDKKSNKSNFDNISFV